MFGNRLGRNARGSRWRSLLPLLSLLLLVFGMLVPAARADADESRVFPPLLEEATKNPKQVFRVIITMQTATETVDGKKIKALGGKWLKKLPQGALDGMVVELPGKEIRKLGKQAAVKYIAPDALVESTCSKQCAAIDSTALATMYPAVTGASALWPAKANGKGWTGKGIGVAVLDTGINDYRLDWYDASGKSRLVNAPVFSSGQVVREDGHGHGTHVAGIIGGNSWNRKDGKIQGKYIGIAPEATLIDVKVSDDQGQSYVSDLVTAIDWVVANREAYNIRVMNLSLVSSVAESHKTSVLAAAVERAWFNGIFVVVAAGNAGPDSMLYPPANDPFVVTVGASDMMGTVDVKDDTVAPWSSYGTTQDGFSKPDLVAPGRRIVAPLTSANSNLALAMSGRLVDDSYIWLSGTSMAAPMVSGLAALAFEAHPEWTNDQLKGLMIEKAKKIKSKNLGEGAGQVAGYDVVTHGGKPKPANQNIEISKLLIGPDGAVSYTNSSWSSSSWSSSSWSSSSWSSSSWSSSSWSSSSWSSNVGFISCRHQCDAENSDSLASGKTIPFKDPAKELGLPEEPKVRVP